MHTVTLPLLFPPSTMAIARQILHFPCTQIPTPTPSPTSSPAASLLFSNKLPTLSKHKDAAPTMVPVKASSNRGDENIAPADDEDGVSLGTMKLPPNIDIARFENLLFQWANSLCQGANLPLPVPLKVDKVQGGARLGFISVGDGETQVMVYIDCKIFPPTESSALPLFRATRNGLLKDKVAPGEPRIMRSLLQALQKSAQIARV